GSDLASPTRKRFYYGGIVAGGGITLLPLTQSWSAASLHTLIVGPAAALGRNPGDIAVRVLHVAGFAVDAVLGVDLEARTGGLLDPLIDSGRAIAVRRTGIDVVLRRLLQVHVGDLEMNRLVLFMVGIGKEYRGQLVEGELAVRLGVSDRGVRLRRIQRRAVELGMRLGSEQREAQRVAPHVEAAERNADDGAELRPQRFDVVDPVQVSANGGIPPSVFVFDKVVIGAAVGKRG